VVLLGESAVQGLHLRCGGTSVEAEAIAIDANAVEAIEEILELLREAFGMSAAASRIEVIEGIELKLFKPFDFGELLILFINLTEDSVDLCDRIFRDNLEGELNIAIATVVCGELATHADKPVVGVVVITSVVKNVNVSGDVGVVGKARHGGNSLCVVVVQLLINAKRIPAVIQRSQSHVIAFIHSLLLVRILLHRLGR
jgi:hypothetical protein